MAKEILISDQTRQMLGEKVFSFVSAMHSPPSMIISDLDYVSVNGADAQQDQAFLSENFNRLGMPEKDSQPLKNIFRDYASSKTGVAVNPSEFGMGDDRWVVVTPGYAEEGSLGTLADGIPLDEDALPGNRQDWQAYILFHEIAHTDPAQKNQTPMLMEYMADETAKDTYKAAYAAGAVSDPNVPAAYEGLKAIGLMFKTHEDYSLNALVSDTEDFFGHAEKSVADVQEVRTEIYTAIGRDLDNGSSVAQPSQEQKDKWKRSGEQAVKDQPEIVYEKARQMQNAGVFADNKTDAEFLSRFIDAAERYASKTFKVEQENIKSGPPPWAVQHNAAIATQPLPSAAIPN